MRRRRSGDRSRTPARPGEPRRRRASRRGWWLPFVAAQGVALLGAAPAAGLPSVNASSAEQTRPRGENRQGVEGTQEGRESSSRGDSTRAVPLDRVDLDLQRPFDPEAGSVSAAADELHRHGLIGTDDTLAPVGREGRLGRLVVSRANQEHKGIPVFAAQVVVTAEGARIVKILGHAAPDVALDSTVPANDYPTTLRLAERLLGHDIAADGEAALVILPVDGGYRLAWLGTVVIDGGAEEAAFDAETGRVLHRVPIAVRVAPSPAFRTR